MDMDDVNEIRNVVMSTPVQSSSSLKQPDRKIVERNRRIHMKHLCGKLFSLIPPQHLKPSSKYLVSQQDQLDQATAYIKQLKEGVEKLEKKKRKLLGEEEIIIINSSNKGKSSSSSSCSCLLIKSISPILQVRDLGSSLQVNLIMGCCCTTTITKLMVMLHHQVIRIIEDEGGQVVSAIISAIGDKLFYTLHAQVKVTRLGMDASEVYGRLKKLITQLQPTYYMLNPIN